jgi:HEAT repeat protein
MTRIIKSKYTIRSRPHLITSARHTCLAAMLFSLLASAAWGQDQADPRISALMQELNQSDYFVRWRAAKALLKIGSYSRAAIPALIEALKIDEGDISERARDALVRSGPDAVPVLIKALADRDSVVSSKAIEILAAIGAPAAPALIEALKNRDKDVRRGVLEALNQIGPKTKAAVPILIELMKDPDPGIRNAAAQNIMCCGADAAPAYLALIEALKDEDPQVRSTAAFAFCGVRLAPEHPAFQPALALLLETLKDPDASVRSGAAQALAYLGSTAKPALAALLDALKDSDARVRASVARALGTIGPNPDPLVVAVLLAALKDPDKRVRSAAAFALKSAPAKAVVYPLIIALQDSEPSVRRSSADSLARRDAGFAVPRLIQLMSDRDAEVRNAAGRALEAIGHDAGKALVKASRDKDVDLRNRAALILEKVDRNDALAAYIEALKDENAVVRSSAASSLGRFAQEPDEKVVALKLIEALKDSDAPVRRSAAISLGAFAYNATVIAALVEALKDPDNKVRYSAAQSLISVHAEGKPVIPVLISALKDQDPQVRRDAVIWIGSLSWEAKAAVPALIKLLRDPNADVLKNAIDALGKIDTAASAGVIVPHLVRLLSRRDEGIREAALGALVAIGEPAAASLTKLLIGPDSSLRVKSYQALVSIRSVPALIAALKSRHEGLRSLVFEVLDEISTWQRPGPYPPYVSFDPTRKYVVHTVGNNCGFEGSGSTFFLSEIDTGSSFPLLVCCAGAGAEFREFGGKYYLLIDQGRDEADCGLGSFWLYDVKAKKFVIHAEGGLGEETKPGVFSYAYCGDDEKEIPLGTVTMKNLLNRESPLRLLPLPMHASTLRKNTKVTDTTFGTVMIIRNAGTKLLVVGTREEDGSIDVYYKRTIANAPKGSLKLIK